MIKSNNEKKNLKGLSWFFILILFPVLWRFFWTIFNYVYGATFVLVFGNEHEGAITRFAFITSLIFAIGTLRSIYNLIKKHFKDVDFTI